jgi:hypothetical protein
MSGNEKTVNRHRIFLILSLVCGLGLSPTAHAAQAASDRAIAAKAAQLLDESLTLLAVKADDKDAQWYENGVWHFRSEEKFWPVQAGPATAAAVLWAWRARNVPPGDKADQDKQAWLHRVAAETFDRALADHLKTEGYYDEKATPATYFFAVELAATYLQLKESVDEPTRARWRDALVKMVDYLIQSNNLPNAALPGWKATDGWYTNGNIELGEAELVYFVWKITGEQKYKDLFEVQWQHTLNPSPQRWKDFGLRITQEPTREDGSDSAGFLAEGGGKEPGYDGDYTHFSLTVASRLYVVSRDPRVLRLMNLLINTLLSHTDESWVLDATHGSRHSLKFPLFSNGLAVAAWLGGRADLAPKIADQFEKAVYPMFRGNAVQNWGNPGIYRGYGCDLAVFLLADMAKGD